MSIRSKLLLIIVGVTLLFIAAAAGYFLIENPVRRMEEEKYSLMVLSSTIKDEMIQLDRLETEAISRQRVVFDSSCADVEKAFGALDTLKYLPKSNALIEHAIQVIRDLSGFYRDNLKALNEVTGVIVADADEVFELGNSATFSSFRDEDQRLPSIKKALADIKDYHDKAGVLHLTLSTSCTTIAEQYEVINVQISRFRTRALSLALAVIVLCVAFALVFAIRFADSVAKSIVAIETHIANLKGGDLSRRISLKNKDELGRLAADLNLFQDSLSSTILGIKDVSAANITVKTELIDSVNESMSSVTQIGANTQAIGKQIANLDSRADASVGSIGKIASSIAQLDEQIENQFARVEDSTSGVTEMLSSLDNMSRVTEREQNNVSVLVEEAGRGMQIFEEAFEKIGEIPKNVSTIRDMAAIIQGLASQTNLLAMNAAIEAAHAGEYGRGFAVVADELRKLSEASTQSSRDISVSVEDIVKTIEEASKASAGTSSAFSAIDTRIREVSSSMSAIFTGIKEIQLGGKLILEAMADLRERSAAVREGSNSMSEGTSEIRAMMEELHRISSEVASNISEISQGIEVIGASVREVSTLSERVAEGSLHIDSEINKFST